MAGHLVHDAPHGLGRVLEDVELVLVEDLWCERPGDRPAMVERICGKKVVVPGLSAAHVAAKTAGYVVELVLERPSKEAYRVPLVPRHVSHVLSAHVLRLPYLSARRRRRVRAACSELPRLCATLPTHRVRTDGTTS